MKKLLTLITGVLLFTGVSAQNQTFMDFGPKVLFGPNIFLNENATFNSDVYTFNPKSLGWGAGFKFAFDFNLSFAVVGEAIYRQQEQVYDVTVTDSLPGGGTQDVIVNKNIKMTSMEFPVMFRYNGNDMKYVEAGVVITKVMGVTENQIGPYANLETFDLSSYYSENNFGAILGIGGYIWGSGNFGISGGIRFRYDLNDMVSYDGNRYADSPIYPTDIEVVNTTNPLSVTVVFEANYDLGFLMAKSSCSGRRKILIGN